MTLTSTRGHGCRVCGQRFKRQAYLALHRGQAHPEVLTEAEAQAYHAALAEEEAVLEAVQQHVRGGLAALPILVLYVSLLILTVAFGIPAVFPLLLLPGVVAFAALAYYLAYTSTEARATA